MTRGSLSERYVGAVLRGVPAAQRGDVGAELRTLISDATEDLVAQGKDPADAERLTVTNLGDPAVLAAEYTGRPRYVIGPAFFGEYWALLRTLLAIVLPSMAVLVAVAGVIAGDPVWDVAAAVLGAVFQIGVQLTFWVTLIFALVERSGAQAPEESWSVADLPEEPDSRIGLGETVSSVVIAAVTIWALFWQRDHWLVPTGDGQAVPILNPDVWQPWIVLLITIMIASILLEVVKYRIGRWTVPLAIVNTVLNVALAVLVSWLWFAPDQGLLNPAVLDTLDPGLATGLGLTPWIVTAICVIDSAEGWWKLRSNVASSDTVALVSGTTQD